MQYHAKPSYYLCLFATALAVFVVILGAYTRLKDAGLGCPDWPGCYGFLSVPESVEDISQAEKLYPDSPFEADKAWPEVIHRYFASALGFVILLLTAHAFRLRNNPQQPFKLPLFLLFLVICQGLFGMWTVTLKLWPQVVTLHLLGGFATLSLLWLLCLRLSNSHWNYDNIDQSQWRRLKLMAQIGLVILVGQIALGGWISSNYAALACPDFPTCQNQWWPAMDFSAGFDAFQSIGPNYLGGVLDAQSRVAIHVSHRIGALITCVFLLYLVINLLRCRVDSQDAPKRHKIRHRELSKIAVVILLILGIQISLGLSNIFWQIPLSVAVAHNAFGALLLLALVNLNYRLRLTKKRTTL